MNREEILEKAIKKALNNGWRPSYYKSEILDALFDDEIDKIAMGIIVDHFIIHPMDVFRHDFAKAFFVEDEIELWDVDDNDERIDFTVVSWEYHIQKMVLEEDPLEYLDYFLNKKL